MPYELNYSGFYFDEKKKEYVLEIQNGLEIFKFFRKFNINETTFWKMLKNNKKGKTTITTGGRYVIGVCLSTEYYEYYSGADREEHKELTVKINIFIKEDFIEGFIHELTRENNNDENNWKTDFLFNFLKLEEGRRRK